jgi:hypothetical protein
MDACHPVFVARCMHYCSAMDIGELAFASSPTIIPDTRRPSPYAPYPYALIRDQSGDLLTIWYCMSTDCSSETSRIPRCAGGEPTAHPPRAGSLTR